MNYTKLIFDCASMASFIGAASLFGALYVGPTLAKAKLYDEIVFKIKHEKRIKKGRIKFQEFMEERERQKFLKKESNLEKRITFKKNII